MINVQIIHYVIRLCKLTTSLTQLEINKFKLRKKNTKIILIKQKILLNHHFYPFKLRNMPGIILNQHFNYMQCVSLMLKEF